MRLNSSRQITPVLVFVGILNAIPSGLLFQSRSWATCSCGIPVFLHISSTWVKGRLNSVSLPSLQSVCSVHWSKTTGNSWSSSFHTVRKHFSLLIHTKRHLEGARCENSPCMSRQHRWCVIVWSSEKDSHVCWMWPKVWMGRAPSVVNLPCDFHNASSYRDHICLIPCCWWSCFTRNSTGNSAWLIQAFSSGLDVGPVFSLVILPVCLGFPPLSGTSLL